MKNGDAAKEILDSLPSIVIVTDGHNIVDGNYSFFDFLSLSDIVEFKKKYNCICELFIEKSGYITNQKDDKSWIDVVKSNRIDKIESKVLMFNPFLEENRSYLVSYSKLGGVKDGAIISFTDITDSIKYREILADSAKALEELVEQRTKELVAANEKIIHKERLLIEQSKMAEMGEMIGVIAHQWKQPLSTLGLLIQDIPESVEFGDMTLEYAESFVDESMEQIEYMNQTISDFRNFFKPSKEGKFSVVKSIDSAFSLIKKQFEQFKITVVKDYQIDESVSVLGLMNEFKQVVINILNNGKDALLEMNIENKEIQIKIESIENKVKIMIYDNGGGIPESILPNVFDSYFSTKGNKGTGIGLQIAKTIIEENMKGSLIAYNNNKGAVFQIELPVSK